MADLESQFLGAGSARDFAGQYLKYLSDLLLAIDAKAVGQIIEAFASAGRQGKVIYFIGNGGSAAIASHLANDIGIGTQGPLGKSFKARSLTDNPAVLTAIANDEGHAQVFLRQLKPVLEAGDVVMALSVSGNSENIVAAVEYAKRVGAWTIGCTGFDGGRLRRLADISLHIPTPPGEYGPVEDVFGALNHLIYTYLRLGNRGCLEFQAAGSTV
ncbi:MAG: SIS domain-containing protein [Acidobacteriota bacterium]